MADAIEVGRFLGDVRQSDELGYVEAKAWLEFTEYKGPISPVKEHNRVNDLLLDWLTRIAFIACATQRNDAGVRAFFADCIGEFGSDLFLPIRRVPTTLNELKRRRNEAVHGTGAK